MTGSAKLCIWISGLFLMACSNPGGSSNSALPSDSGFVIPFNIPCSYLGVTSDPVSYKSSSLCTIENAPPTQWNNIPVDGCVQKFACGVFYVASIGMGYTISTSLPLNCSGLMKDACDILQAYGRGNSASQGLINITGSSGENCKNLTTDGYDAYSCIQQP